MEQAVSKINGGREKTLRTVLRVLQVFILVMLVLGAVLGYTMSFVYYQTNREMFWQWVLMLVLLAVPIVAVAIALEAVIRYYSVEYDYELQGNSFSVYRLIYGRRKWFLSFDLHSVTSLYILSQCGEEQAKALLHGSIRPICNEDAPRLVCVESNNCIRKGKVTNSTVVLELGEPMWKAFQKECRGAIRT